MRWAATMMLGTVLAGSGVGSAADRALPPAAPGVTDIHFADLLEAPGRRGTTYSMRARALDGRRVRLLGYMVRQETPLPGTLLLAPMPIALHEHEYGMADDLPPSTVHVMVPVDRDRPVAWSPEALLLTGILDLGPREEPDGRISTVRLLLDPPGPPEPAVCALDAPIHGRTSP